MNHFRRQVVNSDGERNNAVGDEESEGAKMSDATIAATQVDKADPLSQLPQSGLKKVMLKGAILSLALLLQSISVTAAVVSSLK